MRCLTFFPQAGALLDTGHAHVNGWDIPAVVKALGERLTACHVHDNDGSGDAHLPVGQGILTGRHISVLSKKYAPQATQVFEYCCGFNNTKDLEAHIAELKAKYKL